MRKKSFFQAVLIVGPALLMANLGAMIDSYMHPEIPYFDEEHVIGGGISGLITAVLFALLILYVKRLEKTTKYLSDANAMCTLEIMEHKETEEALRQKEHLLSESQRLAHIGSFFVDATGLMQWSEELYHILGVAPETFTLNMESFFSLIHPEDQPSMQVWIDDCMAGKKPAALDYRIIFSDGTIHFIWGDGEAVFDDENRFLYLAGSAQDITERKLAEEALRQSEEKFRALVESTSDWIWEVDRDGTYTYVSPQVEELLGYKPEEIVGKSPFDLMPPEEAQRVARVFKDLAATYAPLIALENTNLHRDGRAVILETSGVPIFGTDGEFAGYLGMDRDITERKQAEEALQRYSVELSKGNKELQEALANVKQLSGMLPICASCKKIRDDKGYWSEVESYISEHTETVFTSGVCPECEKKMEEDLQKLIDENS